MATTVTFVFLAVVLLLVVLLFAGSALVALITVGEFSLFNFFVVIGFAAIMLWIAVATLENYVSRLPYITITTEK